MVSLREDPSLTSIEVIVHYLVLLEKLLYVSFIVLESLKFVCFFLTCQYYCKAALTFLPSKDKWLLFLNMLLMVGLSIMAIGSIFLIYHGLSNVETEQLCRRPLFLILRIGGEFIVYFFLVIGIVLTK